jgi:hypothetical protein
MPYTSCPRRQKWSQREGTQQAGGVRAKAVHALNAWLNARLCSLFALSPTAWISVPSTSGERRAHASR